MSAAPAIYCIYIDAEINFNFFGFFLVGADILDNHRISRSHATQNKAKAPSAGACSSNSGNNHPEDVNNRSNENTDSVRDVQDVLGPLPALPISEEFGGRWSLRRTSGYSGIYEEILDEPER